MIEYIREVGRMVANAKAGAQHNTVKIRGGNLPHLQGMVQVFTEELNKLDARDFNPAARMEFVIKRKTLQFLSNETVQTNQETVCRDVDGMLAILDEYAGENSGAISREFSYIANGDVKAIIERDYRELVQKAFPDKSWKSTVILAGSILEAVLLDQLTKNPSAISSTMSSSKAPKKKQQQTRDIQVNAGDDEWKLYDMIQVACNLGLLPQKNADAIHYVLREYRNYVHPHLEAKTNMPISEGHATASVGMLKVCLDCFN